MTAAGVGGTTISIAGKSISMVGEVIDIARTV